MRGIAIALAAPVLVRTHSLPDAVSAPPLAGNAPLGPRPSHDLKGRRYRFTEQSAGQFRLNSVEHPDAAYFIMEKMIAGTSGSPAG